MWISFKISEQISLTTQQYRIGLSKASKIKIFQKYLYKICFNGICIKINRIEIIDNLILRKDAQILAILQIELIILRLLQDEYFEGTVEQFNQNGIIIKFFNGLLEGKISPQFLHEKSLYNYSSNPQKQQNNLGKQDKKVQNVIGKWILPISNNKAFTWQLNQKIRFKIQSTNWENKNQTRFADIISLRADQQGLGPISWWI